VDEAVGVWEGAGELVDVVVGGGVWLAVTVGMGVLVTARPGVSVMGVGEVGSAVSALAMAPLAVGVGVSGGVSSLQPLVSMNTSPIKPINWI
jgi:hypothetical protein